MPADRHAPLEASCLDAPAEFAPYSIAVAIDRFLYATSLSARPATVTYYRRCLEPLRAITKSLDEISLDTLREQYAALRDRAARYINHPSRPQLAGGLSIYSLHKYIRAWKRLFAWLCEEGLLGYNPAARLKRPALPLNEPPKDMLPGDLLKLLRTAREEGCLRDYAIICFIADTACRVGGLVSLRMDRLDLDERIAVIREKGDKSRGVCFKRHTERALRRYIEEERPRGSGPAVFVSRRDGGTLTTNGVYLILKRLAQRAGVQGRYNPHSMRHARARQAIKRGASLREVQEVLGHASPVTTARFYAVYWDGEINERHQQLSWLPEDEED